MEELKRKSLKRNKGARVDENLKDKKFLLLKDVLKLYPFSEWSLRYLVRKRMIPYYKFGKKLYFNPEEIDAHMEKHRVPPKEKGYSNG